MQNESKKTNAQLVARYYWRHVKAYRRLLVGTFIALPITVALDNYLPSLILASVLARLGQHQYVDGQLWHSFGPAIVVYMVMLLSSSVGWRVVDYFMWRLEQNIQRDIAIEIFQHLLRRSADFHANNFSGSLVSHSNKLLGSYVRTADTTVFQAYPMLTGIVVSVIILAPRAPLYSAGLLLFSILFLLVAMKVSKPVRRLAALHASQESKQTGSLADAVTNVMAIKSFAHTKYEEERFAKVAEGTRKRLQAVASANQRQMNIMGGMSRLISAGALLVAVIAVMEFHANIATVFLIFSYTSMIIGQLWAFGNNGLRNYSRAVGDATDMVETLNEEAEIQDPAEPEPLRMSHGDIAFKDVMFQHNGSDDPIFNTLNLHIKPGEKVGLVGHSGSGKTTLTRLLLRFSDIQDGEILIDGQNIAHVTQDDLHSQIAYVPQEPLLFHRTIAENIAYGDPEASQQSIKAVAKMASAHEFIATLPQGYGTLVGERGVKLSGGQRQRVAIARAMLKNAPIIALDEATSALDSESEVLIQKALWKLMEGRTAIVIAHRLSTIQKMDRIIVLDNGKIVEEGSHKELVTKKNGTYAKLWAHQSGGFIEE